MSTVPPKAEIRYDTLHHVPPPAVCDNRKLKGRLLLEASQKDPHAYYQFDGFLNTQADCVFSPDQDGDALFAGVTPELRSGGVPVRIQILAGTKKKDAVRVAKKLVRWMKKADWKEWKQQAADMAKSPKPQDEMVF